VNPGTSPTLSVIYFGRNDSYLGDYRYRLSTSINMLSKQLELLRLEACIEILVCDWGSASPLHLALELTEPARRNTQFIVVSPEVAMSVQKDSVFSVPHAFNVALRRAKGKYVLGVDSDVIIGKEALHRIWSILQNGCVNGLPVEDSFFWISRRHMPRAFVETAPPLAAIESHIESFCTNYVHDRIDVTRFGGTAVALLAPSNLLREAQGFDESLIHWGWFDIDLHNRLSTRYKCADLETYGVVLFHLEHYVDRAKFDAELCRKHNPQTVNHSYAPNSDDWGLRDHAFPIVRMGEICAGCQIDDPSPIDSPLTPEIKDDVFYEALKAIASERMVSTILEIGSGDGQGSTEALYLGMKSNPTKPRLFCLEISKSRCARLAARYETAINIYIYNASSISRDRLPTEEKVRAFYENVPSALNEAPFSTVLSWLRVDREYMSRSDIRQDGIDFIRRSHSISVFDLVLIDGSAFTGYEEYREVYGARYIALDDVFSFKCYQAYQDLKIDRNYELIFEGSVRNGFAIFRRRRSDPVLQFALPEENDVMHPSPLATRLPIGLVTELAQRCSLRTFIETGTYNGITAVWAASAFDRVVTIEADPTIYARARRRLENLQNVVPLLGDTRSILSGVVSELRTPAIFWLDSHWSGEGTYGEHDECPLLQELDVINVSTLDHVVLIDDARMFLTKPPPPHRADQWPSVKDIAHVIMCRPGRALFLVDDFLICIPNFAQKAFEGFVSSVDMRLLAREVILR